jgi:hypothetical protein
MVATSIGSPSTTAPSGHDDRAVVEHHFTDSGAGRGDDAGGAVDDLADAGGVVGDPHAGHLGEAAVAELDPGVGVLEDLLELGPGDVLDHRHEVRERHHVERVELGERAGRDDRVVADAATVLDADDRRVDAEVGGDLLCLPQQRVGDQVALVGLLGADVGADAVEVDGAGGDDVVRQRFEVGDERVDHPGLHGGGRASRRRRTAGCHRSRR